MKKDDKKYPDTMRKNDADYKRMEKKKMDKKDYKKK